MFQGSGINSSYKHYFFSLLGAFGLQYLSHPTPNSILRFMTSGIKLYYNKKNLSKILERYGTVQAPVSE